MFMHLVAIEPAEALEIEVTPPAETAPPTETTPAAEDTTPSVPDVPVPVSAPVESDEHREWARARDTFIAQHTSHSELRELSPEQRQILFASIGEEPPFSEEG